MIELGLQRISRLLATTPLPWRAIHVAGTNGKGSICAYVSAMLEAYNRSQYRTYTAKPTLKHARFTSPHLIDRWDCITIGKSTVSHSLFEHVEAKVLQRNTEAHVQASDFEILTATAFEIFTHEEVEVGVVEVGMGGRLDATNVLGQPVLTDDGSPGPERALPLVTAISKIGRDHQAFLGNTIAEIAREKAGIMKAGVPVVYDDSNPQEAVRIIEQCAQSLGCPILRKHFDDIDEGGNLPSTLLKPDHTRRNLSVAVRATRKALIDLDLVAESNEKPDQRDVVRQLESSLYSDSLEAALETKFPGRLQYISLEPLTGGNNTKVLLDGAHNVQSAQVLSNEVQKWRVQLKQDSKGSLPVTWVLAFSSTKDAREMISTLVSPGDNVLAVEFGPVDGMPWVEPLSSHQITDAVKELYRPIDSVDAVFFGRDLLGGLQQASQKASGGPMVVAGSLYLVGDVLRLLRDHPPD